MHEQYRYSHERVSMERNRDLRDYALVNGFYYANDFMLSLKRELKKGDSILDLGCGKGKAIAQAARKLSPYGIRCLALDNLPRPKINRSVDYASGDFGKTELADESVERIFSVCGLFMYAEDQDSFYQHAIEARRILTASGKLSVVVDPVIFLTQDYEAQMARLRTRVKSGQIKNLEEDMEIRQELVSLKLAVKSETSFKQQMAQEVWVQSPTIVGKYFRINIFELLNEAGLIVNERILPKGGMMIDDEVTLVISKNQGSRHR